MNIRIKKPLFFLLMISVFSCGQKETLDNKIEEKYPGQHIRVESLRSEYVVCVVGDTGELEVQLTANVLKMVNADCDEVRHLGDIVYPNGITSVNDPNLNDLFISPFSPYLDAGNPIYLALGNHDYFGNPQAWLDLALINPNIVFPSSYYLTKYNFGLCSLVLDSNAHFNEQLVWLNEFYEKGEAETCKEIIFFLHHPLYSSGEHGNANGLLKKFYEEAIVGRASALFAGHDHFSSYEGSERGTKFFISGGFSSLRGTHLIGQAVYSNTTDLAFIRLIIDTSFETPTKVEFLKLDENLTKLYETEI